MDALYKIYAKIRLDQLKNQTKNQFSEDKNASNSLFDYSIFKLTEQEDSTGSIDGQFSKRILDTLASLDINSAIGLYNFVSRQMDVMTALGLVANLEKRAQYDPRFRTSFPDFLRSNSWFL